MDPGIARMLKGKDGFTTKQDFSKWLSRNVRMPAERYWGYDHVDWLVKPDAIRGIEPFATFLKAEPNELIAPYFDPDKINIVVVGGDTNPLWKYSEYGYMRSESVDKWRPKKSVDDCADGSCGIPDPDDTDNY
jgi:hypothetical protein